MGYKANIVHVIKKWVEAGILPAESSILEFGSQIIEGDPSELIESLTDLLNWYHVEKENIKSFCNQLVLPIPAMSIFKLFGFNYMSLDVNGDYGSIFFDLNVDIVPSEFINYFDFVNNQGTAEHIFNQLNVFKATHDFTKPGGFMRHSVPLSGWFDHGYFNPTLKFWYELAGVNNYDIISKMITFNTFNKRLPNWYIDKKYKSFTPKNFSPGNVPFDVSKEFWYSDIWFEIVFKKNTNSDFAIPLDHLENDQQGKIKERLRENYSRIFNSRNLIIPLTHLKVRKQKSLAKRIREHLKLILNLYCKPK